MCHGLRSPSQGRLVAGPANFAVVCQYGKRRLPHRSVRARAEGHAQSSSQRPRRFHLNRMVEPKLSVEQSAKARAGRSATSDTRNGFPVPSVPTKDLPASNPGGRGGETPVGPQGHGGPMTLATRSAPLAPDRLVLIRYIGGPSPRNCSAP